MKKKLVAGMFSLFFVGALASCNSSSDDLSTLRCDNPTTEIKNKYNISFVDDLENSARTLDKTVTLSSDESYYVVYIANDVKGSLFTLSTPIDDILEEKKNKAVSLTASAMVFDTLMYSSEQSSILAEYYDKTNGVCQFNASGTEGSEDYVAQTFDFEVNTKSSLTKSVSLSSIYDYYKSGQTGITFDVVYMPTYIVRHYTKKGASQDVLKQCLFLPLYYTFSQNGKEIEDGALVDSKISSIDVIDVEFNDDNTIFDGNTVVTE